MQDLYERARKIRVAVFDVDGVLTDGALYYADSGAEMKAFSVHDGHGIRMLGESGVAAAIISSRSSGALESRARNLGIQLLYQGAADKLAAAGYRALVPDLYRGKVTVDGKEAEHLMTGLDFGDAAGQDVRGAVQYLKGKSAKVGVTGFCMGGALTILSAVNVPEADAAVCWYGYPPLEYVDASKIKAPLLAHFAIDDQPFPIAKVEELEKKMRDAKVSFTAHRYKAMGRLGGAWLWAIYILLVLVAPLMVAALLTDRKLTLHNVPRLADIRRTGSIVVGMLRKALDAFARLDAVAAAEVIRDDAAIDEAFRGMMRQLITFMMEDPRTISSSIDLVFVAKAIERVGDHAKNLAEQIIYIVKGMDVRHNPVGTVEDLVR